MFASTADELLTFFRGEVSDAVGPYLWSDVEAYGYMTEGWDALLKQAQVQPRTLRLAFTADVPTVSLPKSLLHINSARIVDGGSLRPANANSAGFARDDYGVQTGDGSALFEGTGTPCEYVRDYERRALRLVPIPAASGELELQGTVTIGVAMESGSPLPSTDAQDLRLVLHYMKALAYQKHDAETEDLTRARWHQDQFEVGVLKREQQFRNTRRTPGVVRMDW